MAEREAKSVSDHIPRDPQIRKLLRHQIASLDDDPSSVVLEEVGICRCTVRADLVHVNGVLHGYEIKSDRDSITRLSEQVALYSQVFDFATLVVGERLLGKALRQLPSWWGAIVVSA